LLAFGRTLESSFSAAVRQHLSTARFSHQLLSLVLIFQIAVQSAFGVASFAAISPATPAGNLDELHQVLGNLDLDPRIDTLESLPSEATPLELSETDPVLDGDPFFLKNQSWKEATKEATASTSDELAYSETSGRLEIKLPYTGKVWALNEPLHPLLKTDEYIFLAANAGTDLFAKKGGGQGIFVVPYSKLVSAAVATGSASAVPVFFFPLPGTGWQTTAERDLSASEIPDHDLIVLSGTEGQKLPIVLGDVRSVLQVEGLNYLFATAQAVESGLARLRQEHSAQGAQYGARLRSALAELSRDENSATAKSDLIETFQVVQKELSDTDMTLAPGSTAGFGILYTGFDQRNPASGSRLFSSARPSVFQQAVALLGISEAKADASQVHFILEKTARALTICGVALITGVVARYTVLRKKIDARIQGKNSAWAEVIQETNIFTHAMKMIIQIPSLSANGLEILMDQVGVPENSSVRQIFDSTFGFVRKSNRGTAVNAKTLLYGGGILSGEDTIMVGLQNAYILKWQGELFAWMLPGLETRVQSAYESGSSSDVSNYKSLALVQNGIAALTSGASSLSQRIQSVKSIEAERVVKQQMLSEGLDPSVDRTEYEKRETAFVQAALKKQGFPGSEDYLFGADTLWVKLVGFFGYQAPDGKSADSYLGTKRPALMGRALQNAVFAAQKRVQENPSAANQAVLHLLGEKQKNFDLVQNFMKQSALYPPRPSQRGQGFSVDPKRSRLLHRDRRRGRRRDRHASGELAEFGFARNRAIGRTAFPQLLLRAART
jgi:hypothetical protein